MTTCLSRRRPLFSAVKHALIHTLLTDRYGATLRSSGITIIDRLDTVAVKVEDAGAICRLLSSFRMAGRNAKGLVALNGIRNGN
jgi:hypothetical protein